MSQPRQQYGRELREARIFIIDDDALSALLLERVLRRSGFLNAWSTNDPEAGLRRVLTDKPDVLLLDLHMPVLDGFSLMQRVHEVMEPALRPAVLMLTADVATEVKEQALALGVRDFLNKPFPATETILRVENLLEVRLLTRRLSEENVQLEALVSKRAAELAAVTHAAADGIFALDGSGQLLSWNRGAEKMFGWAQEEVVGQGFAMLLPERLRDPDSRGAFLANMEEPEGSGEWNSELVCLRRDGSEFPVELSLAGWQGEEGPLFAAVVRDITERHRTEEAERDQRRLEQFVSDIRLCFSDGEPLPHALRGAARSATEHLLASAARIWLLDSERGVLDLVAAHGTPTTGDEADGSVKLAHHIIGRVAEQREPHLTNDLAGDADYGPWAARERLAAMAAQPLVIDGRVLGVLAVFSDVTLPHSALRALEAVANDIAGGIERKRVAEALRAEQVFLRSLLQSLQEGIIACDAGGRITVANDALRGLLGGAPPTSLEAPAEEFHLFQADATTPLRHEEIPLVRALQGRRIHDEELVMAGTDATPRDVIVNGQPVYDDDGKKLGAVVAVHDISDRKRVEAELEQRTFRDTLTGLANRALFMDRLGQAIARLEAGGPPSAVFILDLDNFKVVNASLGKDAGDALLRAMAERISAVIRPSDTAARVGGDEFAVLCEDVSLDRDVLQIAQLLNAAVAEPLEIQGRQMHLTASVGVALLREREQQAEGLLSAAGSAMNQARAAGRGLAEVFDEDIRGRAMARLEIENALRHAADRGELVLHYQPELRLIDSRISGVEALVRWVHPEWGMVSPGEFIPVAEETGSIMAIGRWVLVEAFRSAGRWAKANPENPVMVSVNLSARQLADPHLVDTVGQLLEETGIDPATICLEITESVLMSDAKQSVATLRALKSHGVRLAVDDFGTGYSSLSYLKRFPVDFLKVDRSFVDGLGRDPEDTAIVAAIVNVAHTLGLLVIAEGVETELQLEELRRLGCELGQGFFWSRAIPADEVERLLEARQPVAPPAAPGTTPTPGAAVPEVAAGHDRDDAVAVLAHEMRAPLTVISGYAELLVEDLDSGDITQSRKELETIVRHAHHMAGLIDTIVDLGAIESGRLSLQRHQCEVGEMVREIVDDVAPALGGLAVETRVHATGVANLDARRIRQVVTNLLTNAAKFSPPSAPIVVEVHATGRDARIAVIDHGPGVPPERIGDVFRKFARADRSTPGRGLGLYLSRSIARAHGGDLSCRKAPTGGAEFVLELPLTGGAGSPPAVREQAAPA